MFKVGVPQKERIHKLARVGVVLAVLLATCAIGISFSSAAPDACQDVWQGATPSDPLGKVADPTSVHPGDSVTYTFQWHSTGAANALLEDCYRVDDGSDPDLNDLVSGFYHNVSVANVGDNGSLQTYQYTITIPDDNSLIGHSVVNRAKMPQGSTESRTDFVSVAITEAPCTEDCGGGTTGDTSGTTGDTSGTTGGTTGGTAAGGTTGGNSVPDEVLGNVIKRKPLAQTGSETTVLAIIGFAMLMAGAAMRFGRFGTELYATSASDSMTPADMLANALRARSRDWTCRK